MDAPADLQPEERAQETAGGKGGSMSELAAVWKGRKRLRMGYTTGSCAAAATKAAARMLLSGELVTQVTLLTPKGILLTLEVEEISRRKNSVCCAIRKDAGDDPDVTNGILVFSEVSYLEEEGILLDGGEGIGRVTRNGLEQRIGEAAINKVPRRMILEAAENECERYHRKKGLSVQISIPEGRRIAKKTLNSRLGIEGGLSVLGTTGIVEPMSEKALIDTIRLEMQMLRQNGCDWCYVVPGNYGSDFLEKQLGYQGCFSVKCSNYVGETIDIGVQLGMKGLLLTGHIGKFVKLAAGIMNTHSHEADARMEIFAAHSAMAGASAETVKEIMNCITTSEVISILRREGKLEAVMKTILEKMDFYLKHRAGNEMEIEAIVFSEEEILGMTPGAAAAAGRIR